MKLKSTMKHRRLKSRLLISMLTVALRFSYSLIRKDNVYHAITGSSYNNVYSWGSITYGEFNQNTIVNQSYYMILDIQFNGVYDGTINVNFSNTLSNITIEPFNCSISSIGTQSIQIRVTNANQAFILFYEAGNTVLNVQSITSNLTKIADGVPYLVERINSKLNDVKTYLTTINGNIDNVESLIHDLSLAVNNMSTSINNKLDQLITAVNNIDTTPSQTDINVINDFNTDMNVINNIEGTLTNDLDLTLNNGLGVDDILDNYKLMYPDSELRNIAHQFVTLPFNLNWLYPFIFVFILLGVILG